MPKEDEANDSDIENGKRLDFSKWDGLRNRFLVIMALCVVLGPLSGSLYTPAVTAIIVEVSHRAFLRRTPGLSFLIHLVQFNATPLQVALSVSLNLLFTGVFKVM